uniref:Uncharacterized protein n=1 Tax=Arundo donax TaxID=35708 RepID=A0A0A8Z9B3_ARUDO
MNDWQLVVFCRQILVTLLLFGSICFFFL